MWMGSFFTHMRVVRKNKTCCYAREKPLQAVYLLSNTQPLDCKQSEKSWNILTGNEMLFLNLKSGLKIVQKRCKSQKLLKLQKVPKLQKLQNGQKLSRKMAKNCAQVNNGQKWLKIAKKC